MVIDRPAERRQVFEEAWRVMKNRFYDPKMHGVNWAAAKDKYESLLPHVVDNDELHNVVMEMIGELNASHTGISGGGQLPGEAPPAERIQTRYPGFDMQADASGYYKVASITRKGPADQEYVKLSPGNFILAVNGKRAQDHRQLLAALQHSARPQARIPGELRRLARMARGRSSSSRFPRRRRATWITSTGSTGREKMVEKLTGGQIGYLHIRAMDAPSLVKFQEDLIENRDKKALIIDERFNGGGGIDQELLEILNQRKQYQLTRGRDSVDVPRPVHTFYGPMAVLQNERSASDAEMFPDGFRALGLGKIIGVPTMGAVIGTGAFGLLDGVADPHPGRRRLHRRAARTWRTTAYSRTSGWTTARPISSAGHDRQIEKAIEVLRQ